MTDTSSIIDQAITRESLYGTLAEPTYGGITSFMRRRYTRDLRGVDLVISGVPFDTATSNRPGSRFGPRAIREASVQSAWTRHWPWEFDPFELLACVDYGDCPFDYGTPEQTPAAIRAHARKILDTGAAMLTLGGDHFISYPLLQAHAAKHGPLSLIHFDAHHDLECDGEDKRIDHGSMFYHAVREGLIDPARSIQIGQRTTIEDVMGLQVLNANEVHDRSARELAEVIHGRVGDSPVYLTFDIDCLDPAYAPGTGTPVCGGLSTHQALRILRQLRGINLVGMDVVEVAPAYDHAEITSLAAAALAMEMICLYAARHKLTGGR